MNNDYDEIDKLFFQYFENNQEVPRIITNCIETAMYKNKNKYGMTILIKKLIITIISFITVGGGIVFASNTIKNFFNNSKGLDTAVENGYIEQGGEDVVSNNTDITVKNFLMDDFNLSFTLEMKFDESIDINSIYRITLPNLMITDEQKRIIYCIDETTFKEYCQKNNLNYSWNEFNDNHLRSGANWYIKNKMADSNSVELVYNLYSNKYPKSKYLYLNFSEISIQNNPNDNSITHTIDGNWNLDLEVPEKFYNRESIIYTVKECSDSTINVTDASLYDTCFKLEFNTKVKPIYQENDSEEVKNEKMQALTEWNMKEKAEWRTMVYDEYIIDNSGNKFYPLRSSSEDSMTSYLPDGQFIHMQTFDLTKYNKNANTITLYLKINLPYTQKDVKIVLERQDL